MKRERLGIIIFFFLFFFILLEIRIFSISIFPDPRLKSEDDKRPERGVIYDRNKKELAVNSTFYSFYCRPNQISTELKKSIYNQLLQSAILNANDLEGLFLNKNFSWLKRKIPPEYIDTIKDWIDSLKKNGNILKDELGLIPEAGRYYPNNAVAGCVGLVGIDNKGLTGIENTFNSHLEKGYNVYTTLDADLSTIVFEELKRGIFENRAESGSAAIIDNENREILTMVSYPTFDPNNYRSISPENLKLSAISFIFEPGSVMKQFAAAYALERGYATPFKPIYKCSGSATVKDHEFNCESAHGYVDLTRIIQKSCNVGMVQVADSFKKEDFYTFLRGFGFGTSVNLPLNDIQSGIFRPSEKWSLLSKYMISIGQEIGVTTAQLLMASSVIAGGGIYKEPVLIREVKDLKDKNVYQADRNEYSVISKETSRTLLKMMETVVSENGTAIAAKIEGIPIAGKTGTGQIAKPEGGGYYKDFYNSVFTGYIPSDKPKYTVVVVINKPHGEKHAGGQIAAPVFANIIRRMITSTGYFSN